MMNHLIKYAHHKNDSRTLIGYTVKKDMEH
jgi:hypothetical protein